MQVTSHFPAIVHQPTHVLGFCAGSAQQASQLTAAILLENVAARTGSLHPDGSNTEDCDVQLPCWPQPTSDTLDHPVLAVIKASHPPECALPLVR